GRFAEELLFGEIDPSAFSREGFEKRLKRPLNEPDASAGQYKNQGGFSNAVKEALPGAKHLYLLQEFGTHSDRRVLAALRRENFEWRRRRRGAPPRESAKRMMMEAFCPSSPLWRSEILKKGVRLWRETLDFLAKPE